MSKQSTDQQNSGDPVNAGVNGDVKSPNNWASTQFREQDPQGGCDNNSYKDHFPVNETRR